MDTVVTFNPTRICSFSYFICKESMKTQNRAKSKEVVDVQSLAEALKAIEIKILQKQVEKIIWFNQQI
jgi:hypothetical protein